MKKLFCAAAALIVSSVLSPSIAGSAPVRFDVSLDGYCEVFKLTETVAWNSPVAGTVSGCDKKWNAVGLVTPVDGQTYIIANFSEYHNRAAFTMYFTQPKHGVGSWFWYSSDGRSFQQVSSGTYSKLTADGKAVKPGEKSALYGRN